MFDLSELKRLKFPRAEFAIFGSGPLAIRNLREAKDIDIVVKKGLWKKLVKKYKIKKVSHGEFIKIGKIEIGKECWPFEDSEELIDTADIIEGFRFVKLKFILEWKQKRGSEKDVKDIELIRRYLSKNSD